MNGPEDEQGSTLAKFALREEFVTKAAAGIEAAAFVNETLLFLRLNALSSDRRLALLPAQVASAREEALLDYLGQQRRILFAATAIAMIV